MSCRFHGKIFSRTVKFISGGSPTPLSDICILKGQDSRVYRELLRLGLQNTMYTDDCPVASDEKWQLCPFREEL